MPKKNMSSKKRQALRAEEGFTLVEMIVAVTLVALMAVGMWSIFRTGIRSWARGTEQIDSTQRHRIVLDLVRKQMASAYPLMTPVNEDSPGPAYPIFYGTETSLSFISLNSFHFNESPGLTLVNYAVMQDSDGENYSLMEQEQRYLGEVPDSLENLDLSNSLTLFDDLTECYFEYRKADNAENASEELWVSEWNGEEMQQLPVAISLTMISTDINGISRNRNIFVPVHAPEANQQTNALNIAGVPMRGRMNRDLRRELEDAIRREAGGDSGRIPQPGMGPPSGDRGGRGRGRGSGEGGRRGGGPPQGGRGGPPQGGFGGPPQGGFGGPPQGGFGGPSQSEGGRGRGQ